MFAQLFGVAVGAYFGSAKSRTWAAGGAAIGLVGVSLLQALGAVQSSLIASAPTSGFGLTPYMMGSERYIRAGTH